MRATQAITAAVCFLFLATIASAQMGLHPPQFRGVFSPIVGQGAVYDVQTSNGRKMNIEIAVVGEESVAGKDGYWMEMTMLGTAMGNMVTKSLTVIDGPNVYVSKMVVQFAGNPPMELPSQAALAGHGQQPTDIRQKADDLGSETVATPAGVFQCEHYRAKDGSGDSWISEKVRPYALVKTEGKDSHMILIKLITDAKDKISGAPQPFNPMMMGQRPQ